ncbi:hypothetical protein TNCV_1000791 [Trichonephila clavipes]|nr:hypothetical protein TNCV_1000791 [Trichonephila clavipes]
MRGDEEHESDSPLKWSTQEWRKTSQSLLIDRIFRSSDFEFGGPTVLKDQEFKKGEKLPITPLNSLQRHLGVDFHKTHSVVDLYSMKGIRLPNFKTVRLIGSGNFEVYVGALQYFSSVAKHLLDLPPKLCILFPIKGHHSLAEEHKIKLFPNSIHSSVLSPMKEYVNNQEAPSGFSSKEPNCKIR